jgi:hypothetical protein
MFEVFGGGAVDKAIIVVGFNTWIMDVEVDSTFFAISAYDFVLAV